MTSIHTDGYQVERRIFTPAEITAMRSAISDGIDRIARVMLTPFEASAPGLSIEERLEDVARRDRAYAAALLQVVMADVQHDVRISAIQHHPLLADAVARVVAPATPSQFVIRTRAAPPAFCDRMSPWHQDVVKPNAATGCARVQVACWIPLGDVDADTGALEVIPGRWTEPFPHDTNPNGHFEITDDRLATAERRVVPLRQGDVLLLDRFIPHRSCHIAGSRGRWAVVMWVKTGGTSAC
jgi:hypothetical protein